jgi:hypothetical protein
MQIQGWTLDTGQQDAVVSQIGSYGNRRLIEGSDRKYQSTISIRFAISRTGTDLSVK